MDGEAGGGHVFLSLEALGAIDNWGLTEESVPRLSVFISMSIFFLLVWVIRYEDVSSFYPCPASFSLLFLPLKQDRKTGSWGQFEAAAS